MIVVVLLSAPAMYVISFFKNKGALTSILLIVVFGAVFGLYYFFIGSLATGSSGDMENIDYEAILKSFSDSLIVLGNVLFPLYSITRFALLSNQTIFGTMSLGGAMIVNLLLFVVTVAVLLCLIILISTFLYRKSATRMSEGGFAKGKVGDYEAKSSTVFSALIKKEWRELMRTPAFAFQSLSGVILSPLLCAFMAVTTGNSFVEMMATEVNSGMVTIISNIMWYVFVGFIAMIGISMNIGAQTTFSREGDKFYYSKLIPVDYKTQVHTKLALYLIISCLSIVLSLIVLGVIMFNFVNILCAFIFLMLYNFGYTCLCLHVDLSRPKLKWVTPNEAVKNNRNSLIMTFLNMGVSILLIAIPIVLMLFVPIPWLASLISWGVLILVGAASAIVFYNLLINNAEKNFERIQL